MPKDFLDTFFDWLKNIIRDHWGKMVSGLLMMAFTYLAATWQTGKQEFITIKGLPIKVDSLISANKKWMEMAKAHARQDSAKDRCTADMLLQVNHRIDSSNAVVKNIVTLILDHDKIIHPN